ncbi:hypothetical protein F4819DRAFT_321228 [Hypoxylon fuscum]|nr:hypothetical protein F4819DRAFT_321228 [Hypoxylon fuscum]
MTRRQQAAIRSDQNIRSGRLKTRSRLLKLFMQSFTFSMDGVLVRDLNGADGWAGIVHIYINIAMSWMAAIGQVRFCRRVERKH